MAEVHIKIAGRAYRMACDDGQEEHLHALGTEVDAKITAMRTSFGEIGDMRLTVMASVVLADELFDARRQIAELRERSEGLDAHDSERVAALKREQDAAAEVVESVAARIEAVAADLNSKMRRG
jgi:cell division protein ZapA